MGKVRYYAEDGNNYITLRVEADGIYIENSKQRVRKRRDMPPKDKGTNHYENIPSSQAIKQSHGIDLLSTIGEVLDDLEATCKADDKAMAVLKPRYKKSGFTLSIRYRNSWSDYDGPTALDCLLQYHEEVLADTPPPTPLEGGKGIAKR